MEEPVDRFPRGGDQSLVLDMQSMHEYLLSALYTGSTPPLCDTEIIAPGWSSLAHVKGMRERGELPNVGQSLLRLVTGVSGNVDTQLSLRWPEGYSQR